MFVVGYGVVSKPQILHANDVGLFERKGGLN
jgi:hypothetical protein